MATPLALDSSDFVARFRQLETLNVSLKDSSLPTQLPDIVQNRLDAYSLAWTDLTPFAQQALLWDTGIVVASTGASNKYLQVFVPCNTTMQNITVTPSSLKGGLDTFTCPGPNNTNYARQQGIARSFSSLEKVLRCAIDDYQLLPSNSSAFSQNAMPSNQVPILRVLLHTDNTGDSRPVIHSYLDNSLQHWPTTCPSVSQPTGLIIPCQSRAVKPKGTVNTCAATPSAAMNSWLASIQASKTATSQKTSNEAVVLPQQTALATPPSQEKSSYGPLIGGIVGGVVGLLLLAGIYWYCRIRRARPRRLLSDLLPVDQRPTRIGILGQNARPRASTNPSFHQPQRHEDDHARRPASKLSALIVNPYEVLTFDATTALSSLEHVRDREITYEAIVCDQLMASGSRSEIYYGRYNYKVVAIKVITLDKVHDKEIVDAFAEEIRLMASFRHPNIVAFIGFAWNQQSLASLTAVTEYLSQGNLSHFLTDNPNLHWDLKASLALDIARALQYLHNLLQPPVIHRDLKSKNILLDWPSAKLSGFGVSRKTMDNQTMTAGVGSAFYMAPEALRSGYYSLSADMYSFGCVLCELDTQQPLYSELTIPSHRIMHFILEEDLVPSLSPSCPRRIRSLAEQCFHRDPNQRPTAFDAARVLDAYVNGNDVGGGLV
ncbi:unnamed protein product [Aphanomyces euteiches]|uniref:Protein kinase domain-containing protein n=1 Tax=Aphanomyces euteiches TaxID=100861 RepID=A0A6G0XLP4_9STRA|nr:hypothetical protein Ae201684_003676 [Aphanomyces euteiches]KAH9084619.1 hypothetical protein Ae201684P_001861 [Aphanomyces euteiches]KAH9138707.1 hypothetical protein AeRB84_016999 [Aphanomyces euteiches]